MEGMSKEQLHYNMSRHHRENLAKAINPLIQAQIEVSPSPTLNYIQAKKTIFMHDLAKQQLEQQRKREWESQFNQKHGEKSKNILKESAEMNIRRPCESIYEKTHFKDYYRERTNKFEDHILKNQDGGVCKLTSQEAYQKHRIGVQSATRVKLLQQIQERELFRLDQKNKAREEQIRNQENRADEYCKMQNTMKYTKDIASSPISFNYNLRNFASRHNPITNPIDYHIDNPYILKKIQDYHK